MSLLPFFFIILMGAALGLAGGGGSVLTVPILVYGFHISATIATGYSLFLVGSTSLFGTIIYGFQKKIAWKKGLLFSIPSIFSIFITRNFLVPIIPQNILVFDSFKLSKDLLILMIFAFTMLFSAYSMIKIKSETEVDLVDKVNITEVILKSLLIGVLSGIIGAGGGFLIVPVLIFLIGLDIKTAAATSLFVITLNSLIGFTAVVGQIQIQWNLLMQLLVLALFGNLLGIILNKYIKPENLKKGFGYLIGLVAIMIIFQELTHFSH